jgi:hypothetical protein
MAVSDTEEDLRATAEDIASDAARLTSVEEEKISLEVDDPRLPDLSAEAERLAKAILPKAAAERQLVEKLQVERTN